MLAAAKLANHMVVAHTTNHRSRLENWDVICVLGKFVQMRMTHLTSEPGAAADNRLHDF